MPMTSSIILPSEILMTGGTNSQTGLTYLRYHKITWGYRICGWHWHNGRRKNRCRAKENSRIWPNKIIITTERRFCSWSAYNSRPDLALLDQYGSGRGVKLYPPPLVWSNFLWTEVSGAVYSLQFNCSKYHEVHLIEQESDHFQAQQQTGQCDWKVCRWNTVNNFNINTW